MSNRRVWGPLAPYRPRPKRNRSGSTPAIFCMAHYVPTCTGIHAENPCRNTPIGYFDMQPDDYRAIRYPAGPRYACEQHMQAMDIRYGDSEMNLTFIHFRLSEVADISLAT